MSWLLARTCFLKIAPKGRFSSCKTRAWSRGPLTAYMPETAAFPGARDHQGLYQLSVEQSDTFWGALGRSRLMWISPFHCVSSCNLQQGHLSWFLGGQLNVSSKWVTKWSLSWSAWRNISFQGGSFSFLPLSYKNPIFFSQGFLSIWISVLTTLSVLLNMKNNLVDEETN